MEFLLLLKKNVNIYLIMKKDILSLSLSCRTQRRDFSTIEPPANNLKAKEDMGEKEKAAHNFGTRKRRSWTSLSRHHSAVT
jgi:hypothetical protein